MAKKRVCVIVKSRPFSRINYYEALRLAAGLWEHEVSLIWMGDGIYAVLKGVDTSLTDMQMRELPRMGINMYVEYEALKERGFKSEEVRDIAKVVGREKISELLANVEVSIVF